jgi:hypothetical protein
MPRPNPIDPDGTRLPIKLDSTSNGEYVPIPLEKIHHTANRYAHERATEAARKLRTTRRKFLTSACGAASTLLAFNEVYAANGKTGGFFDIHPDSIFDDHLAQAAVAGNEFIFDVQGHFVNPQGAWLRDTPPSAQPMSWLKGNTECAQNAPGTGRNYLDCYNSNSFIKDVFMDSDTDLMVLSFVPSSADAEPLSIEEAAATAELVEQLGGTHRLLLHGRVNPNQPGDMDTMDALASQWGVAAWKCYTQYGPDDRGFFLDDEDTGIPFIEKARALGVKIIAIHKGLPFGRQSYEHSTCIDVGRVARRYPDVSFLIYHSGYVPNVPEGPYDPTREDGIDALVRSLIENNIAPNSNVYAELGSTWRLLMRDPASAAHTLGKLFKYAGEDNVLWGTDSIWYGSPQDQIQAFRTFQLDEQIREQHDYTPITPELRAKVFGLNALKPYGHLVQDLLPQFGLDQIASRRTEYLESPDPHYLTYGPKTRREFLNLLRWSGGKQV